MVAIKVKWGKEVYTLDVDTSSSVLMFKRQLQELTAVPVEKQKIMGMKCGLLHDDDILGSVGVAAGKTFMLIGSAEGTVIPNAQPAPEESTASGGHAATAATSNGLVNIANTCYMNAAIQMLRVIPEVKEVLQSYTGSDTLVQLLGQLFVALDTTNEAVTPTPLWASLIQANPMFAERSEHGGMMQHDTQEVLNMLLERIQEALPSNYAQLYRGKVHQTLRCVETEEADVESQTESSVPFTMLSCNIGGEVQTLEAGLAKAFDEHFQAQSAKLGREASFRRLCRLSLLPEYVFVHMVRFSWKSDIQKKAKMLKPITFPLLLDMSTLCTEGLQTDQKPEREKARDRRDKEVARRKSGRTEKAVITPDDADGSQHVPDPLHNESGYYELCGVISHKGRSADSGHYVCWGKRTNQWLIFDDENVGVVTEEDVLRLRGVGEAHIAYVLLYRSRDPISRQPVMPS